MPDVCCYPCRITFFPREVAMNKLGFRCLQRAVSGRQARSQVLRLSTSSAGKATKLFGLIH